MKNMLKPCKDCKTPGKCQREGECAMEEEMEDQMEGKEAEQEDEGAISIKIKISSGLLAKAMGLKKG